MLVHKKTLRQIQSNPGLNLTILRGIRTWWLCAAEHLGREFVLSSSLNFIFTTENKKMVNMKVSGSKFKLFTTYHNHVVSGGQLKTESYQAGSHMYNTWSLFLKTSENILKYTNFISRNVILNFYKIDIYLLFTKTLNDRPFVPAAPVKFHTT